MKPISSYVKDEFINKIKVINEVPEKTYLVTVDVKLIFTNISKSGHVIAKQAKL